MDWDAALRGVDEGGAGERARVESLREVARIADFSRSLVRAAESGESSGAGLLSAGAGIGWGALPERWGDLLLLERIGAGAHSDVVRAWDPKLQREVALKLLRVEGAGGSPSGDGAPTPLEREGRAAARVRHPHVVAIHGIDRRDGRVGLWMEYVKGATLEEEIARTGPLSADEVAQLGAQIGSALSAVHAAGVLHRDVKPANIVRDAEGRFVLVDFGLGTSWRDAAHAKGRPTGTPLYMAPELLAGESPTVRSDLYALGLTMRFALVGRHAFAVETLEALRERAQAGAPPVHEERPGLDAGLAAAIERASAPRAEARFTRAGELIEALRHGGEGIERRPRGEAERAGERGATPAAASAAPRRDRAASTSRGLRVAFAAAVVGVLGVVGVAWLARIDRSGAVRQAAGAAGREAAAASGGALEGALPSTVAATPAADPALAAYSLDAGFLQRDGSTTRRLLPGDRVEPGDRLSLEVHASRPVWTYVLNEDERGERFLLFPQPMFDQRNPLPADSLVVLPGSIGGRENAWTVTSRGGREHFLVVISPEPVAELEADLGRLPAPEQGRPIEYASVAPESMERLRGVGGVEEVRDEAGAAQSANLFAKFRALAGRENEVRGLWVRSIVFENPIE